jgi:hypothetical protein
LRCGNLKEEDSQGTARRRWESNVRRQAMYYEITMRRFRATIVEVVKQ